MIRSNSHSIRTLWRGLYQESLVATRFVVAKATKQEQVCVYIGRAMACEAKGRRCQWHEPNSESPLSKSRDRYHFVSTEFSISKNGTLRSSSLDSCMLALAFCAAGLFAVVAIVGVKAGCSVDCCARVCLFKKPMNCTGGRLLFSDKRRSCSESRGP